MINNTKMRTYLNHSRIIDDSMGLVRRLAKSEGTYVAAIYSISNFALIGVLFMGAGACVRCFCFFIGGGGTDRHV